MTVFRRTALVLLLLPAATATGAPAQAPNDWDTGRMQLTRAELETLLARYDGTARSDAHSAEFRNRARFETALIRTRLREGDFQIGDQITLSVEGEAQLTGDFVVTPQRTLSLPVIGEIPLEGVLRSELQAHVTEHLKNFIREPVVRSRSSIRLLISGHVGKPGYYLMDTESLLSDALMQAGGPGAGAELTAIRVERGAEPIWEGESLQRAIAEGRTMDQLSLRAGDHLVVPADTPSGMSTAARTLLTGVPALLLALTSLMQIF